jgi:hypothetical protein
LCGRDMFHLKLGQIRLFSSVFLVVCLLGEGPLLPWLLALIGGPTG